MTEPLDRSEREALCDLLLELGPDAPTLCVGWTTAHLAAHLALRERFRRSSEEKIAAELHRGHAAVVARVRRPPPVPWRVPGVRRLNTLELLIHHEDVRRANGAEPRAAPKLDRDAWRFCGLLGRRVARRLRPYGLALHWPEGEQPVRLFGQAPRAELHGAPVELLLYLSGRADAAQVQVRGDSIAAGALSSAELSM